MTTADLALLLAETRCAHSRLALEDAERVASGDDWIVYLRAAAHPCAFQVRDYHAFQSLAPVLPAAWIVPRTRAERTGHDYHAAPGALTLPDLARLLADAADPAADPAWRLHALHRTGPDASGSDAVGAPDAAAADTYLVEFLDPATGEVRAVPSLSAYRVLQGCHDDTASPAA